ncbi:DUF1517 domain-containing protein [Deinococcus aerius]|uniref:DUF1517 domain-containing protein n=1 Tax=Deinococcus aerius TaxID=200253 RepID=UPI0013FD6A80|nr:DUF1517 domain-containing protein [Deinococcus aerius]
MGALLAFVLLSALYEGWAGRRRGTQAVRVQVLFGNGEDVKRQLQLLARRHDPDAPGALAILLRESALLLLRHKADWAYGTVERRAATGEDEANATVGQWATAARAAFETQTTSQYQNGDKPISVRTPSRIPGYCAIRPATGYTSRIRSVLPFSGPKVASTWRGA